VFRLETRNFEASKEGLVLLKHKFCIMLYRNSRLVFYLSGKPEMVTRDVFDTETKETFLYTAGEMERLLRAPSRSVLESLHNYWLSRHRGSAFPRRRDIDPVDIPALLPNVFLIDVLREPELDFRVRLFGTRLVWQAGELTGKYLSEFMPKTHYPHVWEHYECTSQGGVALRRDTLAWQGRRHLVYEALLLPMAGEDEQVWMFLAGATLTRRDESGF